MKCSGKLFMIIYEVEFPCEGQTNFKEEWSTGIDEFDAAENLKRRLGEIGICSITPMGSK